MSASPSQFTTDRPSLHVQGAAGVFVVLVALLTGVAAANQCAAEAACAPTACSTSFAASAKAFPYTATYTTTGDAHSTTFVWKVTGTPWQAP